MLILLIHYFYLLVHYSFVHLSAKLNVQVRVITSYGNVFSFFLCVYIIAFYYIYVSNLRRASFIIYLRFTLTIYILLLFYFVFLLFALYIFHLFFSFFVFVSIYFSLYILFICFLYSLIFSFKDFLLCSPRKFYFCFLLLVYVYGYKFVLFASYKKRSSISEPLFSLFYFFEEFRCCSKIFCFSKFLFSLFYSLFQSLGACLEPLPASLNSNHKSLLSFVPMDVSHS